MKSDEKLVPPEAIPEATRILTNVAYLMGDVTATLMLNAEGRVNKLGFNMKQGLKQRQYNVKYHATFKMTKKCA